MSSTPSSDKSTEALAQNLQTARTVLFNKTTVTIFCAGLAIYLLYSLGKSIFSPRDGGYDGTNLLGYSRAIDVAALIIILGWMYSVYVGLSDDNKNNLIGWFLRWTQDFWNNPNTLLEITLFTLIFFACVYLFRVPMAPEIKPVVVHIIETKIWIVFAMFIVIFFFKYVLGIPIIDLIYNNSIMNYFENLPSLNLSSSSSSGVKTSAPAGGGAAGTSGGGAAGTSGGGAAGTSGGGAAGTSGGGAAGTSGGAAAGTSGGAATGTSGGGATADAKRIGGGGGDSKAKKKTLDNCPTAPSSDSSNKEVFNISNYVYTYEHAKEVCNAFGADLATYDQIEQAYNKEGEWCNYGWSEGQLVLMPTQKATWEKLQLTKDQKNMCGRPGVNGGFLGNKEMRFGANCYGVKPARPDNFMYDKSLDNLEINMENTASNNEPTEEDMWRASAKLNAFNNLKHEWSQY